MMHINAGDMKRISRIQTHPINGTRARVKAVSDGGEDFLMLLIPFPKGKISKLIDDLTFRR